MTSRAQGEAGYQQERDFMSLRTKVFAAAATLTLVGGFGAASTWTSANAATPSCGPTCLDLFSKNFGTHHNPQFVLDVFQQARKVGQPVILFRESNSDPAEDWTISNDGYVSDFFQAGLVSAEINLHYGCDFSINTGLCADGLKPAATTLTDDYAFEAEYSPYGVASGLCAGLAATATSGEKVTLQPCGDTSKTVWVTDTLDSCPSNPLYSDELQLINGSDNNFSHPYVLEYPASGYPTDTPRPQLLVDNLTGFSQSGGGSGLCGGSAITGPDNNQLWTADEGVLP